MLVLRQGNDMSEDKGLAEKLTGVYIKIRERRAQLQKQFKEEDDKLTEQLDKVKRGLLDFCEEQGLDSVKTPAGLFYRSVKTRYWTNDWEEMHKFVLEHEVPEFYEKRLNQANVRQFLEENPNLLPKGLNVDSEYTITVRKK
jgi:hypothetical protein